MERIPLVEDTPLQYVNISQHENQQPVALRYLRWLADALLIGWVVAVLSMSMLGPLHWHKHLVPHMMPHVEDGSNSSLFRDTVTVPRRFATTGYGQHIPVQTTATPVRIFLANLPPRYMAQYYDAFMHRPVGGTGEGHEIGWAAPLGRVLSLGGPLHTINTGPGVHLYNTDQFSNDVWWFTQVYTSPLRVATYEEADVVFVPGMFARADPGMESEADYAVGFRDFYMDYMPYLPNVTDKPHVVGFSRVVWPHAKEFKVMHSLQPLYFTALEPFTGRDHTLMTANDRIVPIPYQGHAHWDHTAHAAMLNTTPSPSTTPPSSSSTTPLPTSTAQTLPASAVQPTKQYLASSCFRSRTNLRVLLRDQCTQQPGRCIHREYEPGNVTDMMEGWREMEASWYCLQPPGDTLTRRALFDCLLAGTIPVVFDYTTLEALPFQQQVPWHDMIITLSPKGIEDGSEHVVELLHSMHSTERAMQRLAVIHQYRHVLQYSLAPVHGMITYEGAWVLGAQDDAYTAGWKALVRRMCEHQRLPHHKCCRSQGYRAVTDRPC